ncbi:MarR family winged helix-turn-helix transcriptional regulator [Tsukamurella sp. 1534]|uniref:MarR family winged helix-turn-helix transcriptional regulator n=1 Tax=Tsukamurella sp. 1534 TaxID=1151061 RepID=UPI0003029E70|nr:MarR family winged helix-turn-helix transcriptional regulator [Tsukamurella sp. 1534]
MAEQDVRTADVALVVLARAAAVERAVARALRGTDFGVPHWTVLAHLAAEGATMAALAERTNLPAATLTRTVDKLVDRTLVHRSLDGHDRRRVVVRLTDRGAATLDELSGLVDAATAGALEGFEPWETQALQGLLGRFDVST